MSWISTLSATYDNCASLVGKTPEGESVYKTLLPLAHTIKLAQLEVTLDEDGDVVDVKVLEDKGKEQPTILPCTSDAAGRTSFPKPYALADQIKYVAGDYLTYGGDKKYHACHASYLDQLQAWCDSPYGNDKVRVVLAYLKQGRLIEDLVEQEVLVCGEDGTIQMKWTGPEEEKPPFYRLGIRDLSGVLVRFNVDGLGGERRLWRDPQVWKSYTDYYISTLEDRGVCYVTGEEGPVVQNHPKFLRSNRDGAKLISAQQEESPFGTKYKGNFSEVKEVVSVGYEASAKAHEALRWLIARQGCQIGDFDAPLVYVAWGASGEDVVRINDDTFDLLGEELLREGYANDLGTALRGYLSRKVDLTRPGIPVVLMGVDSAVPGRLSIVYYREITQSAFLDRVIRWHTDCAWQQIAYKKSKDPAEKTQRIVYYGAPAPTAMIGAAYGGNVDKKYVKSAMKRLMPCIYDGAVLPRDMIHAAVTRLSQRTGLEDWEYRQDLGIVCSMIRKHHIETKGRTWNMKLDQKERDRSYRFGRLLAYAENTESLSMYLNKEPARQTNAERLQHQFTLKPAKTYAILWDKLTPYFQKLPAAVAQGRKREMEAIYSGMDQEDTNLNGKLDEVYLLGYSSQMMDFQNRTSERKIREEMKNLGFAPDVAAFAAGQSEVDVETLLRAREEYQRLKRELGIQTREPEEQDQ